MKRCGHDRGVMPRRGGERHEMTVLQLASGKEIRVPEAYGEIRALLERALAEDRLLELARADGTVVLINPRNVDYIQAMPGEGEGPQRAAGAV
jgi:hypothetical protein